MEQLKLSKETIEKILRYLQTKPYGEVHSLISTIVADLGKLNQESSIESEAE